MLSYARQPLRKMEFCGCRSGGIVVSHGQPSQALPRRNTVHRNGPSAPGPTPRMPVRVCVGVSIHVVRAVDRGDHWHHSQDRVREAV